MTGRVADRAEAVAVCRSAREAGRRVVFTNGCFDVLHRGHADLLAEAKKMGDLLVVGLNDDASVARLKGPDRPWVPFEDRAALLAALAAVDLVVPFAEDTPRELIREIEPDVLVKGADYGADEIVGADLVAARGGTVVRVPLTPGRSTSRLLRRLEGGE